jgi:restriction system protein
MAIPDYQTLMLPVLRLAAQGETRVPDLSEKLARELGLTPDEAEQMLSSGRQRILHNRIHWAKFYMSKAGLIASPRRGWFAASDTGKALLANAPQRIDVERLLEYPAFRSFYRGEAENAAPESENVKSEPAPMMHSTPEEQIDAAHSTLKSALQTDLLARILECSPVFFEGLIVDLLVKMGYGGSRKDAAKRIGGSGDGGVDGVINEDRLGLDRVYVQAKRYKQTSSIGRPEVQGFVGSLVGLGATKGVFVTTSTFTTQAVDYVRHLSQRVILLDGKKLSELMIEHNVGVRVIQSIEIKRLDEGFFAEDD